MPVQIRSEPISPPDKRKPRSLDGRATAKTRLPDVSNSVTPLRSADGLLHDFQVHQSGPEMRNGAVESSFADRGERMRVAEPQREDPDSLVGILDAAVDGVCQVDCSGKLLAVNRAYCQYSGYSSEELLRMRLSDLEATEGTGTTTRHIQQIIAQGRGRFESTHRRKDGSIWHVDVSAFCCNPADGRVFAFVRDMTDRRASEEVLRASEERYRRLHETLSDAFVMTSMSGRLLRWNDAYQQMLGYSADELSRMTYVDVTPRKWHAMEAEIVASQIIPSGRSEVYEKEYVRKDGTTLAVELRTILLRDNEGRPEAMWAIVRDVTERKQAENRLRAAFHYARSLLEASLDPMVTISAGGKIMDANKATETATGISRETIIGSDFCDYFTEPEKARAGYQQVFSMGYVTDYPLAIRHVSGVATDVLYNASIYRDESGNIAGVFAAARDITKLKSAQRELENTNHEILMLGQMADLLQSCHSAEESFPIITATMAQLFPESSGSCFIIDEAGSLLEEVSSWGDATPTEKHFSPDDCWALRRGHLHSVGFGEFVNPRCKHLRAENAPYACVPLLAHGKTLGIIYLSSYSAFENETLTQHRRNLAQAASDSISLALANLKLRESLHALSLHDSLTGLFNRRFMEETLARDLSRIARIDNPLVIAMLDIDRFKTINDRFGHDAGDVVLKEVARLMMGFRAGIDVPCRFGGEEFILILPEIATKQALSRLEQLRISIGELNLNLNGKVIPRVTVSIGVAVFPEHGDTATALIKAADNALYRAKRNGRNRIEVADSGRSELDRLN